MFRIVAATRLDRAGFLAESLLGRSMERVVVPDAVEAIEICGALCKKGLFVETGSWRE